MTIKGTSRGVRGCLREPTARSSIHSTGTPLAIGLAGRSAGVMSATTGMRDSAGDLVGFSIREAGDVNGDGLAEVIVGGLGGTVTVPAEVPFLKAWKDCISC